jgi:hypothetical protein
MTMNHLQSVVKINWAQNFVYTQWSQVNDRKTRWAQPWHKMGTEWAQTEKPTLQWAFVQAKCLILLVAEARFELATFGL